MRKFNNPSKQPQSSKVVTPGNLVDFSLKNDRITLGKEIISPKKENNRILEDDLYEDNPNYEDKKNNEEEEDEEDDLPLMRVRRLSFKSKEMGKLRSAVKLKGMVQGGPVIDEAKAQKAAERYFKKRQQFIKSNGIRTDTDFRDNKKIFDKIKQKNEEPPRRYTAIATDNLNKTDSGNDKRNNLKDGKAQYKAIIYKKNVVRNNNDKNDDNDNEKNERIFVSKYARFNNVNEINEKNNRTVDNDRNNNANKFYRRIKPATNKNENNNTEIKDYRNRKSVEKIESDNKRIFVKKAEFTDNKKVEPKSYRRRYNNPVNNKVMNETEIEISIKPKIEEDTKNAPKSTTSKYYNRVRVSRDQGKLNDKKNDVDNEPKKIVVNSSGFGRWKKH